MTPSRTNLLDLVSRPGRFEHHLTVVARIGDAQLEIAAASEPLYFAHVNVSDEYALALPTGDFVIDHFPLRTFLSDAATGEDVARYNHRIGDLVLHPLGLMHWPGRLRPPHEPIVLPPGVRGCAVSLVFCASAPTPADREILRVSGGREADAKSYVAERPPLALVDVLHGETGIVARVGQATLRVEATPAVITAPRGAYVVVLGAAGGSAHRACDLIHVPSGAALDASGIERALVFESHTVVASGPPDSWLRVPEPAIPPFESGAREPLPFSRAGLTASDADAKHVTIGIGATSRRVPRHWLARMLFRVALHRPLLGYVETYGGFFFDDRRQDQEGIVLGLRDGDRIALPPREALAVVDALYRAVAPEGYTEHVAY